MDAYQFGLAAEIPYPAPPSVADSLTEMGIEVPVDISGVVNADPEVQNP
jgi:hypothetical protein